MDCFKGISYIDDAILDLVITSPPYNVDLGNNKYHKTPYTLYNDNRDHKEYLSWLEEIFNTIIYPKLKTGGRVVINIGDGENGSIPTHSDIIQFMSKKYIPMTTIVWNKHHCGSRTAWGSFCSPSSPSFPTQFEYILVFCKETKKLQYVGETDLSRDEFISWSNSLWDFSPQINQKEIGHPAMFPVELVKRCLKMFSYKGALVLDPFIGSGTTAVASIELNRKYIGFEISKEYVDIANKRISDLEMKLRNEYMIHNFQESGKSVKFKKSSLFDL